MSRTKVRGNTTSDDKLLVYVPLGAAAYKALERRCEEDERSKTKVLELLITNGMSRFREDEIPSTRARKRNEEIVDTWTRLPTDVVDELNDMAANDDRPRTIFLSRMVTSLLAA